MPTAYLYASHRYDIIFYARLISTLDNQVSSPSFHLLITPELYYSPFVAEFIETNFPLYSVLPPTEPGTLFPKLHCAWLLFWFRFKYRSIVSTRAPLIALDKSQLASRIVLNQHNKVILIQQKEEYTQYSLLLVRSTKNLLASLFFSALPALSYRVATSNASLSAVQLLPTISSSQIIRLQYSPLQSSDSQVPLVLPTTARHSLSQSILIFGSRFYDWPYFLGSKLSHRLAQLRLIYGKLRSTFPTHSILYIPHPLERGPEYRFTRSALGCDLHQITDYFSSEQYLLQHPSISATFSIGSTSSYSAYTMGFPSMVFYRSLSFPKPVESVYDNIFSDLPNSLYYNPNNASLNPAMPVLPPSNTKSLLSYINNL